MFSHDCVPIIAGFFGLEGRRTHGGEQHVFHHGERGQYNSALVGDAIAPTIRLAEVLSDIIASGGSALDYFKATGKEFKHRIELAITKTRMSGRHEGHGFTIFSGIVDDLNEQERIDLLTGHGVPKRLLKNLLVKNPNLALLFLDIAKEYAATYVT